MYGFLLKFKYKPEIQKKLPFQVIWLTAMIRIKKNKPQISQEMKSFRVIRRLNLNWTYPPLKIGAIVGYILLGMLSIPPSLFGIFVGAVLYHLTGA